MTIQITTREPFIATDYNDKGERRLSLRGLATMLNVMPADSISLSVTAEALRSESFYVRYNAAKKLAKRTDRDARLLITYVLNNGSAPSRASVARHLYGLTWYSAEPLIRQALQDADPRVREAAVYALCDLHELAAYELLTEALANEVDSVREAAAWGLRHDMDSAAVPALEMVLRAESPDVQVKALEALGVNGSPEALRVTYKILVDTERDPEVIYAATLSVLELAGEATLPYIITALRDSHGAMRQQILRGLFHATNYLKIDLAHSNHTAELFDVLAFCLRDPMSQVREAVAWILAWTRHTAAQDLLAQAYTHETDPSTKAQIEHITASLSAVAV